MRIISVNERRSVIHVHYPLGSMVTTLNSNRVQFTLDQMVQLEHLSNISQVTICPPGDPVFKYPGLNLNLKAIRKPYLQNQGSTAEGHDNFPSTPSLNTTSGRWPSFGWR